MANFLAEKLKSNKISDQHFEYIPKEIRPVQKRFSQSISQISQPVVRDKVPGGRLRVADLYMNFSSIAPALQIIQTEVDRRQKLKSQDVVKDTL